MAYLKRPGGGDDRDRGQLLLVTGIAVAFGIVALVLILNTAIYTQNLATRDIDAGGSDALAYQNAVETGVGGLIDAENDEEHGAYATDVEPNVSAGIETFDDRLTERRLAGGASATIDAVTYHQGFLVRQTDDTRSYTDSTGGGDWDVASGVDGARNVDMYVDRAALNSTTVGDADDGFHVEVTGSGESWTAYVYENGGEITVAVSEDGGAASVVCSTPAAAARIDFTEGTVAGDECGDLSFAPSVPAPYTVRYVNGGEVRGTYNLTVNTTTSTDLAGTINGLTGLGQPYRVPAVYSANVDVYYETPDLRYRATVRVAPGDARD